MTTLRTIELICLPSGAHELIIVERKYFLSREYITGCKVWTSISANFAEIYDIEHKDRSL